MPDSEFPTVSVCLASFNGALYIADQVRSILSSDLVTQLIVSDDGSTDETVNILSKMGDPRLVVVNGPQKGVARNFENALKYATGRFIFLSDQDDIWLPEKVSTMCAALSDADMVISDCYVVDESLRVRDKSFFGLNNTGPSVLRNLVHCGYLGCCMAFKREVLAWALPLPDKVPMHDWWFGLVAGVFGRVKFIDDRLALYRRHGNNLSAASEASSTPYLTRMKWRLILIYDIAVRAIHVGYRRLRSGASDVPR